MDFISQLQNIWILLHTRSKPIVIQQGWPKQFGFVHTKMHCALLIHIFICWNITSCLLLDFQKLVWYLQSLRNVYVARWKIRQISDISNLQKWILEWLKVSKFRKQIMVSNLLSKNKPNPLSWKITTSRLTQKRESMFFLQEDRLTFVLTLK